MKTPTWTFAALITALSNTALAAPVTYLFTAEVNYIEDATNQLNGSVNVTEQVTGKIVYDGTTTGTPITAWPEFALHSVESSFLEFNFESGDRIVSGSNAIHVYDNQPIPFVDGSPTEDMMVFSKTTHFAHNSYDEWTLASGSNSNSTALHFHDTDLDVFDSNRLPPEQLALADFEDITFRIATNFNVDTLQYEGDYYVISGNITSISAVPVPAAAWLFSSALIGLVGFKRKSS